MEYTHAFQDHNQLRVWQLLICTSLYHV